jgi:hypothetical protein
VTLSADVVLEHSPDVAARLVGGRVVLAPLHAPPGDDLDDLFTLNASGQAVWEALDGASPLTAVVAAVGERFGAPPDVIRADVTAFVADLLEKGMVRVVAEP